MVVERVGGVGSRLRTGVRGEFFAREEGVGCSGGRGGLPSYRNPLVSSMGNLYRDTGF